MLRFEREKQEDSLIFFVQLLSATNSGHTGTDFIELSKKMLIVSGRILF